MLTPRERKLLREWVRTNPIRREQVMRRALEHRPSVRVNVAPPGRSRRMLAVTANDFNFALAQLTLLGEL